MIRTMLLFLLVAVTATHAQSTRLSNHAEQLRERGEPLTVEQLITWPPLPDDRNGAKIIYTLVPTMRKATRDGGLWQEGLSKRNISKYPFPFSAEDAADIKQALAAQADVLATLDRLADAEDFDWGRSLPSPLAVKHGPETFPFHATWGAAYAQLYFDGLLALHEGDGRRAWRRIKTLERMADGFATYPGNHDIGLLAPHLYERAARLATAAVTTPGDVGIVDRELAQALIKRWLDDRTMTDLLVRRMRVERVAVLDAVRQIAAGTAKANDFRDSGYMVGDFAAMKLGHTTWPIVADFYSTVIDAALAKPELTAAGLPRHLVAEITAFSKRDLMTLHVANTLGGNVSTLVYVLNEKRTIQKLAALAVAVRLYRQDHHGDWPATLNALLPKYLPAVPTDPMAEPSAPLHYRSAGEESVIWSVGPDHRNDDGKPPPPGTIRSRDKGWDDVVQLSVQLQK